MWFQSVCPLMPSLMPTILLGFLLPWMWGVSSQLLQQSADAAPYLGRGVTPPGHRPDLGHVFCISIPYRRNCGWKILEIRKYAIFTKFSAAGIWHICMCCCCSVAKSCLMFCDLMDCSTPGFPVIYLSPGICSNSCPLSQWCHPTISSSVVPFSSCPQSFPASGSFPICWHSN